MGFNPTRLPPGAKQKTVLLVSVSSQQITPQGDGSLQVNLHAGPRHGLLTAYRPEVARAKGLPEPANYLTHTTVRDPNEVFAFSFRDVNGKLVLNDDLQFKNKVVLAIVTGTWCPDCHDEAQYLVQLYSQYHSKVVEIVALDFEEADQVASLTRGLEGEGQSFCRSER